MMPEEFYSQQNSCIIVRRCRLLVELQFSEFVVSRWSFVSKNVKSSLLFYWRSYIKITKDEETGYMDDKSRGDREKVSTTTACSLSL